MGGDSNKGGHKPQGREIKKLLVRYFCQQPPHHGRVLVRGNGTAILGQSKFSRHHSGVWSPRGKRGLNAAWPNIHTAAGASTPSPLGKMRVAAWLLLR